MIRDYEKGSGFQGALQSVIGERITGVLSTPSNVIILLFESGGGAGFHALNYGAVALRPMSVEDVLASVKERIRDANLHQANLAKALQHLGYKPKAGYVSSA